MGRQESRRVLAERADRVARALERDALRMVRPLVRDPYKYTRLVTELDDASVTAERFSEAIRNSVDRREWARISSLSEFANDTPGEDAIQLTRWGLSRVVYAVDPDAAAAVIDTDWSNTVIPGEVLRRLPHPDPLVVLPEPVQWMNTEGRVERYEAFGVFGVREPRRRCSTHHPDVKAYALHFFGREVDPVTGQPYETLVPDVTGTLHKITVVIGMRSVTPLVDMTMVDREKFAVRDMLSGGWSAVHGFASLSDADEGMSRLTKIGLALLVYLVSDDADTRKVMLNSGSKRDRRQGESRSTSVIEVGFRIGAALRSERVTRQGESGHEKSGRTVAPHIRRAHLHTFRRGPGRSERVVRWLPPIAINADKQDKRTQVHVT